MEMLVPWKRKMKNVVCQYNDTQIKVRDATSNDPCNPPLGVLIELADLSKRSYELVSIMQVIWKRVNDRGTNWRHCYKSLYVLEYLIKMGDVQVFQQSKQNIRALQVLTQFQFVDEFGKDVGINVRQKAMQVLELLTNEAKLLEERDKELKNREKHEKMQQQVRQQQLQQQMQQQQALGASRNLAMVPKGNDTYVHRLDRSAALQTGSGGYDDPYGGATGSYDPSAAYQYNDFSAPAAQPSAAFDASFAYANSSGQFAPPQTFDAFPHPQSASASFNPFQTDSSPAAQQQQQLQQQPKADYGASPEQLKQRMATNPFLCDFAPESNATCSNDISNNLMSSNDLNGAQPEPDMAQLATDLQQLNVQQNFTATSSSDCQLIADAEPAATHANQSESHEAPAASDVEQQHTDSLQPLAPQHAPADDNACHGDEPPTQHDNETAASLQNVASEHSESTLD